MSKTEKAEKLSGQMCRVAKKTLSMTGMILLELIESMEDFNFMYFHRYAGYCESVREARYAHEARKDREKERLRKQAIERLRASRLVKLRREGERVVLKLTTDGKIKALKTAIRLSTENLLDGRICLVSFDVPEASNTARVAFRRFLKGVGFKFVQGSVWSIDKDVSLEMFKLIGLLGISRWVEIYIAQKPVVVVKD